MRNETLIENAKKILKDLLAKCTNSEQLMFKRMYSHQNLELDIDSVVDSMDPDKMDWAITQCEKTVEKHNNLTLGYSKGEKCNRYIELENEYCKETIAENDKESGCSCHISPPCSSCVTPTEYCPGCEWDGKEEYYESERISMESYKSKPVELYKVKTVSDLDPTKIDYVSEANNGHYSTRFTGVYPEGTTSEEVLSKIRGAFGGKFEYFGGGRFCYIAYND